MNRDHFFGGRRSGKGEAGLRMPAPGAVSQESPVSKIFSQVLRPNISFLQAHLPGSRSPDAAARKLNLAFQQGFMEPSPSGVPQELLHNLACSVGSVTVHAAQLENSAALPAWLTPASFQALGCQDFGARSSPELKLEDRVLVKECIDTVKECAMHLLCPPNPEVALLQNCKVADPLPMSSLKRTLFQQCHTDQVAGLKVMACVYGSAGGPHSFMGVGPGWETNFCMQAKGAQDMHPKFNTGGSSSQTSPCAAASERPPQNVDSVASNAWGYRHVPQFSWSPAEIQPAERQFNLLQPGVVDLGILTPDQDNGYSSLEEEQLKLFASDIFKAELAKREFSCGPPAGVQAEHRYGSSEVQSESEICKSSEVQKVKEEASEVHIKEITEVDDAKNVEAYTEVGLTPNLVGSEGNYLKDDLDSDGEIEFALGVVPVLSRPVCQNKLIAEILGYNSCGSSDGDEYSEDVSDSEEDDDDGFDSEGTFSDSDCSSEDTGILQLWNSFTSSKDPYDLYNFTAKIQTGQSNNSNNDRDNEEAPEALVEEFDASSSVGSKSPPSSISTSSDDEDDSFQENSIDDSENLKLWNAFNNSQDPYNPFNFKAQLQTGRSKWQGRPVLDRKRGQGSPCPQFCISPPCKERDGFSSGFSESAKVRTVSGAMSGNAAKLKKVTFVDEVVEYYVCSQEDRKGPWEELARDRCRFQKRVQEIEISIGPCFAPEHRQRVLQRLLTES